MVVAKLIEIGHLFRFPAEEGQILSILAKEGAADVGCVSRFVEIDSHAVGQGEALHSDQRSLNRKKRAGLKVEGILRKIM